MEEYLQQLKSFHGSMAPGLIIGGHMANLAMKTLPKDKLYDAICLINTDNLDLLFYPPYRHINPPTLPADFDLSDDHVFTMDLKLGLAADNIRILIFCRPFSPCCLLRQ
jgi:hypothetical protein